MRSDFYAAYRLGLAQEASHRYEAATYFFLFNSNFFFLLIEGYQFQCTLCSEAFNSHSMLKVHRSKVHKGWKQEKAAATAAVAGIILKIE